MPEILIHPATLEDTEFLVSGNASMALETEDRALDTHTLRAGVCAVFDDPARGFYLIAEIDGQPANRRQRLPRRDRAFDKQRAQLIDDLPVRGRFEVEVDLNPGRRRHCLLYIDTIQSRTDCQM